jgi:hypothetical protein
VLGDEAFDGRGVDVERRRVDVAEHRPGAGAGDGARGREEGVGRREHLVARPDAEHHQRDQQRIGARRDADAMRGLRIGRHGRLELAGLGPEDELLRLADGGDHRVEVLAKREVLGLEVE